MARDLHMIFMMMTQLMMMTHDDTRWITPREASTVCCAETLLMLPAVRGMAKARGQCPHESLRATLV